MRPGGKETAPGRGRNARARPSTFSRAPAWGALHRIQWGGATRWKKTERYNLIFRYPKDSEPILAFRPADMQSAHASDARQARPLPPQFDKRTYSRSGSRLQEPRQLARASPERDRQSPRLNSRH